MRAPPSPKLAIDTCDVFPGQVRVLTVSERPLVRARLRLTLENRPGLIVVGEAQNTSEAIDLAFERRPDSLVVDVCPAAKRMKSLQDLQAASCGSRILFLADDHVDAGRRSFASSSFCGTVSLEMVAGILLGGGDWELGKLGRLTSRELAIIELVGCGLDNEKVAERLCLSRTRVQSDLRSIFKKLGVADRFELIIYRFWRPELFGGQAAAGTSRMTLR
jgi:DNA-binding NarL/FixJ family response regulator